MEINIGEIIIDEGVNIGNIQLDVVEVSPELIDLNVTPSKEQQVFNHDGEYGYDKITVEAVTSEADSNIKPENIKNGINILGVTGNVIPTTPINDASYLFYNGARTNNLIDILSSCQNVINCQYMFANCTGFIYKLDLSNFDTSKVNNMANMFASNGTLEEIIGLNNFNTSQVKNMSRMFFGVGHVELDLSNFDTSNVTNMSYMFYYFSGEQYLDLSSFRTPKLINVRSMFQSASQLIGVNMSNFDTSNVTNMYSAFSSCSNLTNLDLSSFYTPKVENMDYMFNGCEKLTKLDIRNFVFNKVTNFSQMFGGVPSNCEIIVKDDDARNWILGKFSNLTNVKTVAEL